MKVFLDTNVLASAFATRGLCADVFREVMGFEELVISQALLDELKRILEEKFGLPAGAVSEIVTLLCTDTEVAKATVTLEIPIADPDDKLILNDALSAENHVFVTGDKELQNLGRIGTMEILSPRGFWEKLRG